MHRHVIAVAFLALLTSPSLLPAQDTRSALTKIARDLPFLDAGEFLSYRRLGSARHWVGANEEVVDRYQKAMLRLCDGALPEKDLIALLNDKDATIRVLALVALFDREDPRHLTHIHAICADAASTIAAPVADRRASIGFGPPKEPLQLRPQTVGEVARLAVENYLSSSNLRDFSRGPKSHLAFERYWKARQDRAVCVGWYVLKFYRANMGTTAESPARSTRLLALRKEIQGLREPERSWVLLRFAALHESREYALDAVVTEEDILRAAGKIGPEKLLALLEGKNPSGDPDLDSNEVHLAGLPAFVLKHAKRLLDPAAAKRLLVLEKEGKHAGGVWWTVAAAELAPGEAAALLKAAAPRFREYEDEPLLRALWRASGPKELPFILDWYYLPRSNRPAFVNGALRDRFKDAETLLRAIVQDKRFLFIDWPTLDALIPRLNEVAGKNIVSDDERRGLQHPLGMTHFSAGITRPDAAYAKENEIVFNTLTDWRGRIEAEVAKWK